MFHAGKLVFELFGLILGMQQYFVEPPGHVHRGRIAIYPRYLFDFVPDVICDDFRIFTHKTYQPWYQAFFLRHQSQVQMLPVDLLLA